MAIILDIPQQAFPQDVMIITNYVQTQSDEINDLIKFNEVNKLRRSSKQRSENNSLL
jgi:hypothetical protein